MNRCLLFGLMFFIAWDSMAATYQFQGENYAYIHGPNYSNGMRITGRIEFSEVLEPFSYFSSDQVLSFEFNDGIQTLNQANSEIYFNSFQTDDRGIPFTYTIYIIKSPGTNALGETYSGMYLYFGWNTEGYERSEMGFTGPCLWPGATHCLWPDHKENSGWYSPPGLGGAPRAEWTFLGGVAQAVPFNRMWMLLSLVLLVLSAAFVKQHKRR